MRLAAITKFLGVVLLIGAAHGTLPALADDDCRQACENQYALDQQACLDTYDQTLADLQAREDECLALPPGEQDACAKRVNRERKQAKGDYKNCLAKARVGFNHCRQDCSASPAAP
jgi:hypothetical protein